MDIQELPRCEETQIHPDAVERVRGLLPQDEVLYDLAELFKIFGDSTRIKILYALLEGELCVCDIAKLMEVTQSAVSHQLRVLKSSKLVKFPAPEFYLFYVGNETWDTKTLKLSDSFQAPPKENSLELVVNFVNLNYNEDNKILQKSPSLLGYSKLLHYIKTAAKDNGGDLKSAIDTSVKQCMEEGLIEDFLRKHSREVTGMLFNEITVEEFAEIRAREAYEDGEKSGEKIGFVKGEKSGFTKGETAGLVKGAAQEKREIAKSMIKEGIAKEIIKKVTGLSAEEVEEL